MTKRGMRLEYFVVWALLAIFSLNSCNDKNSVLIRLKINSSRDSKIYLEKLDFSKSTFIDSAEISKGDNGINFRVKSIIEPTFFVLRINDKDAITLLSEPDEEMDLVINTENLSDYSVVGSKGSLQTKRLSAKLSETKSKLYNLRIKYNMAKEDVLKATIEKEYNAVIDSQRAFSTGFIWENAMSRASVMAVYQKYDDDSYVFDRSDDLLLFKTVASTLKALYPNSNYTKGMIAEIKKIEEIIRRSNLNNFINQSISTLPEIALPNTQGEIIKLSKLKGKVVLLDFWASWDQNSLMDNRELLDIYKQYRHKGFEIYMVSLDSNRDEWLNAIESAGLPWINVCDLNPNGSRDAQTYNVTQLPANYLIDRSFTIIGKNLYGEDLKRKLQEVF